MSLHAQHKLDPEICRQLDQYFSSLGQGVNAYLESHARRRQIAYLARLSDADLAHLGISRHEIVRHVFRDRHVR